MTLDELLALLPDNTAGEISAADLRTIVTELFNKTAENAARISVIETSPANPDTKTITGRWQIQNAPNFIPGAGQVGCDTGSFSTAALIRFNKFEKSSQDMTNGLLNALGLYGQQWDNASNWIKWDVTGTPVVVADYVEVPVTFLDGAGVPLSAGWHDGLFVMTVSAP